MKNDHSSLTIEQKVGQLFFIGIAGVEVDAPTRELLADVSPGGVCLFSRNIRSAPQTRDLLDAIRETSHCEVLLSIDQEGGLVDRLRRVMTPMPSAAKLTDASEAGRLAQIIAEVLRTLGFNMNFAPVVDVIDEGRSSYSNGLFSRTYGNTKEDVVDMAGTFLAELQAGGIIGCLKHFPGLAAAQVDSHEELPIVNVSEQELDEVDLYPYRKLLNSADVHAIMAAHAAFPLHRLQETDQNGKLLPSSLSHNFVTELLRGEFAFDGLVITDDLEMGAIVKNYGIGEACKMAVNAGADMLAICAGAEAVRTGYNAVLTAVNDGKIDINRLDGSISRIFHVKDQIAAPRDFDPGRIDELSAKIAELTNRA